MKKLKSQTPAYDVLDIVADAIGGKVIREHGYVETNDGLRLIFRDGEYAGFYTHTLAEALN